MDVKKLEGTVSNGYKLGKRLGDGSFGVVYEAERLSDGKKFAIKVESSRATSSQIFFEYDVYIYLHLYLRDLEASSLPIPNIFGLYSNKDLTFFVMDLLGPSLQDVFRKNQKQLSPIAVVNYAKQMINLVKKIHIMNFVYRDIKPENFVFANSQEKQLKIIDFGLSKKINIPNEKCKIRQTSKVIGTLRYASISAHQGKPLGRKDDMESLAYVIIYLIKGSLPWQGIRAKSQEEKDNLVYKMKKSIATKQLCDKLPQAFQRFVNYVKDEDFFQKDECYTQLLEYLDEGLEDFSKLMKNPEPDQWIDICEQFCDSPRNLNSLNMFKQQFTSPPTAQRVTSSNQAANTYQKNQVDLETKNKGTPTKKKPIKMPTIRKKFTFNDDSDTQIPVEKESMRKKTSTFVEDEEDQA